MTETWKNLGAAISLANLLMLALWDEAQDRWFDYYRNLPDLWFLPTQITISMVPYAAIAWGLWTIASRARSSLLRRICLVLLASAFFVGLDLAFYSVARFRQFYSVTVSLGLLVCFLAVSAAAVTLKEDKSKELLRSLLLVLLPLLPLVLFQSISIRQGPGQEGVYKNRPQAPQLVQKPDRPRVVWIIFDEFDQRLVFTARPSGLDLPELDLFKGSAFYAEHAQTVQMETELSIPSLLTGRVVNKTERKQPNDLILTFADESKGMSWSDQPSIFSRAYEMGVNTALVGFFHPYCRIIRDLGNCYSALLGGGWDQEYLKSLTPFEKGLFYLEEPLFRSNLLAPLVVQKKTRRRAKHSWAYRNINDHGILAATNPNFGLVFLHYPVPHLPGIYNRRSRALIQDSSSGYLDNLALIDRTLAELRKHMQNAGLWEKTTVVISSDHPLREATRAEAVQAGDELEAFAGGQPQGVPFMVKLPGRADGLTYDQPFSTVLTQRLVLAILSEKITDSRGIANWFDRNRQ